MMQENDKTFVQWNDKYSVKSKTIDDQHKNLIAVLNRLYNAYMNKEPFESLKNIIDELYNYTAEHFATEEKLMRKNNFAHFADHSLEHQNFTRKVYKFQEDYSNNRIALSIEMLNFLGKWINDHILGTDQMYVEYLQAHGLND